MKKWHALVCDNSFLGEVIKLTYVHRPKDLTLVGNSGGEKINSTSLFFPPPGCGVSLRMGCLVFCSELTLRCDKDIQVGLTMKLNVLGNSLWL